MRFKLCLFLLLCLPSLASAAQWQVDASKSTLSFTGNQGGDDFKGGFARFTPIIDFDPTYPEKGRVTVTIDMSNVTIDGQDRQKDITTDVWFDTAAHPNAIFTSTSIKADGKGGFIADGTLAMKGISQPVSFPFTLTTDGKNTRAQGLFTLKRNLWKVGLGDFDNEDWVAFSVKVVFDIHARKTASAQ